VCDSVLDVLPRAEVRAFLAIPEGYLPHLGCCHSR